MTKQIPLTQGKFAIVDDEDFEWLNRLKWFANQNRKEKEKWYAMRIDGKKTIRMHREITNAPKDMHVDHKDNNGLNNTRENLRVCTNSQNQANSEKDSKNSSGYKGVYRDKNKWRAELKKNGKKVLDKTFSDITDAARAYDKAAAEHFGEFAKLNFPNN